MPYQPDQSQEILHNLYVTGSWGEGTIAGQDVFRTYVLQYLGLLVPADGRVNFDLSCEVNWWAYGGGGQFIAAGGGRSARARESRYAALARRGSSAGAR